MHDSTSGRPEDGERAQDPSARRLRSLVCGAASRLDPATVAPGDAVTMLAEWAAIEHAAGAVRLLLGERAATGATWKGAGARSAEDWLARQTGTSAGKAKNDLATARRLAKLPDTAGAAKRGDLSGAQTEAIAGAADANPGAEGTLLGAAGRESLGELKSRCDRTRAAADTDPEATRRRIHAARKLKRWVGNDGLHHLMASGPAETLAGIDAAMGPFLDAIFTADRATGNRQEYEVRAFDALAAMAASTRGGGPAAAPTPPGPPGGGAPRPADNSTPGPDAADPRPADPGPEPSNDSPTAAAAPGGTARRPADNPTPGPDAADPRPADPTAQPDGDSPAAAAPAPGGTSSPPASPTPGPDGDAPPPAPPDAGSDGAPTSASLRDHDPGADLPTTGDELAELSGPTAAGPGDLAAIAVLPGLGPLAGVTPAAIPPSAATPPPPPTSRRSDPRYKIIIRADLAGLVRGHLDGDEICEIAGVGAVPVTAVRDLLGDATVHLVLTNGTDVANVTHLGRGPTAAQRIALLWQAPRCTRQGCAHTARLEVDHRHPWAKDQVTRLENLDPLCHHDHALKTRQGWALVAGTGRRPMVGPHHSDHPRHAASPVDGPAHDDGAPP